MAVTAKLSISNSSLVFGQGAVLTLTLTNTGSDDTVTSVRTIATSGVPTMAVTDVGPISQTIPGSGSTSVSWPIVFGVGSPSQVSGGEFQIPLQAVAVCASAGNVVSSNTVSVSLTAPLTPPALQPTAGSLRYDSNIQSGLCAAVIH